MPNFTADKKKVDKKNTEDIDREIEKRNKEKKIPTHILKEDERKQEETAKEVSSDLEEWSHLTLDKGEEKHKRTSEESDKKAHRGTISTADFKEQRSSHKGENKKKNVKITGGKHKIIEGAEVCSLCTLPVDNLSEVCFGKPLPTVTRRKYDDNLIDYNGEHWFLKEEREKEERKKEKGRKE